MGWVKGSELSLSLSLSDRNFNPGSLKGSSSFLAKKNKKFLQ